MRKLVATINLTIDGFCDHTAGIADADLHRHYTDLLNSSDTILYGRTTNQLMESYWPALVKTPSGVKDNDNFAMAIQNITKVLFSRTLKSVSWENTRLVQRELREEASDLKRQAGKDILVGSPSLIAALTQLGLIDEFQLCVHPVIVGHGLQLFKGVTDRMVLKLLKTKTFASGAMVNYYEPAPKTP